MGQRSKATTTAATDSPSPTPHNKGIELLPPASSEHHHHHHHHRTHNPNDASPLLPPATDTTDDTPDDIPPDVARDKARIDAIVSQAASLAAKRIIRQLAVCAVLLVPEAVAVGLVASALGDWKRVKALPDEARVPV